MATLPAKHRLTAGMNRRFTDGVLDDIDLGGTMMKNTTTSRTGTALTKHAATVALSVTALALAASSAIAESPARYAQSGLNDYCITCWAEPVPQNAKRTCWAIKASNQLSARIQGDVICARNFGNLQYGFGHGKCSSKSYCKTIR
jgi:hypothetical protein